MPGSTATHGKSIAADSIRHRSRLEIRAGWLMDWLDSRVECVLTLAQRKNGASAAHHWKPNRRHVMIDSLPAARTLSDFSIVHEFARDRHRRSPRVERAISRLIDVEVPQSFEALPYFRTIDPALDFMITFPARSALQQQSECSPRRGSIFSPTQTERIVRRARTYFHIPFCQDICKYCIFFIRYGSDDHAAQYLKAAASMKKSFGIDPLVDSQGQRMRWTGRLQPTESRE